MRVSVRSLAVIVLFAIVGLMSCGGGSSKEVADVRLQGTIASFQQESQSWT
jgi:hypothetical protein